MKQGRPTDNPKTKTFSMRTSEDFLNTLDELADAIGSTRTGAIEFAVNLFPTLGAQNKDGEDG